MTHYTPEQVTWIRYTLTPGIGTTTFWHHFPQHHRLPSRKKAPLDIVSPSAAHHVIQAMDKMGGSILFYTDEAYPPLLRTLTDPPPLLYCLGNTNLLTAGCLAVVGGRNASLVGQKFATGMAAHFSQRGLCTVSGLALGIDQAAHHGALRHGGGTIAVLAGGVDRLYPQENKLLYERLKQDGLILSEMPPQTIPSAQLFPKRNRIISGLSAGVVVVEASLKSGSLITARCALEQNREVMAVPGFPTDPRHHGCNHLIRQGAALVESADDVLMHMAGRFQETVQASAPFVDLHKSPEPTAPSLTQTEISTHALSPLTHRLLHLLGPTPMTIDEITTLSGFASPQVTVALTELEMVGKVSRSPGGHVVRL